MPGDIIHEGYDGAGGFTHLIEDVVFGDAYIGINASNGLVISSDVLASLGSSSDPTEATLLGFGFIELRMPSGLPAFQIHDNVANPVGMTIQGDGTIKWHGSGLSSDVTLARTAPGVLELNGSRVSAFAHLTEDFANGFLHSDIGLSLGTWDPVGGHADHSLPHLEMDGTEGIFIGDGNGTLSKIKIQNDGSLYWGNGTSALDTWLIRASPGTLVLGGVDGGGALYTGDLTNGPYTQVGFGGYLEVWAGATTNADTSILPGVVAISGGNVGPAVLRMTSPDGTAYNITVANGGTLSIVPL